MANKTLQEMIEELEQFYEAAGFENYYENVLKNISEEEIMALYRKTQQQYPEVFGKE